MSWLKDLRGRIKFSQPLKDYTTFKIGGPAEIFFEPKDHDDLRILLKAAEVLKLNLYVIGAGSNLLISDKGIKGVVLRLSTPYFKKIVSKNNYLFVSSGVLLAKAISFARQKGLSGIEFLSGIPGTVGGALVMNAGISWRGKRGRTINKSISDVVETVTVMDYHGRINTLSKKNIRFGYRNSSLSKYIVLSTRLKLEGKAEDAIKEKIAKFVLRRKVSQDLAWPSAGCVFKNPKGHSAGKLIERCDLKGRRLGDICVSLKHSNFILNTGKGRACDVLKLMDLIKKRVKHKFKIDLKPEIKIWQ